jgi:hypothetical protein
MKNATVITPFTFQDITGYERANMAGSNTTYNLGQNVIT